MQCREKKLTVNLFFMFTKSQIQKTKIEFTQPNCFIAFLILILPALYWDIQLRDHYPMFFHIILFLTGWLTWTFIEYILHRFWSHSKKADNNKPIIRRHQHHHTHPTDIKVTSKQRIVMLMIGVALIIISIQMDNYMDFLAGSWTGFFWFFQMHYFLHQSWVKKVFPELLKYHIVHHCKQPDRCFGISATWWDRLFGTGPNENAKISSRIVDFYFDEHH